MAAKNTHTVLHMGTSLVLGPYKVDIIIVVAARRRNDYIVQMDIVLSNGGKDGFLRDAEREGHCGRACCAACCSCCIETLPSPSTIRASPCEKRRDGAEFDRTQTKKGGR
jgi:hypothetical protein